MLGIGFDKHLENSLSLAVRVSAELILTVMTNVGCMRLRPRAAGSISE